MNHDPKLGTCKFWPFLQHPQDVCCIDWKPLAAEEQTAHERLDSVGWKVGARSTPSPDPPPPPPPQKDEVAMSLPAFGAILGRAETAEAEVERLREALRESRTVQLREGKGESWFWQGDGWDFPDSINCPVIMQPEKLRELLGRAALAPSPDPEPKG